MDLTTISALEYSLVKTTKVLNHGFSDYIVPVQMGLEQLNSMLKVDSVDLGESQIVIREGEAIGVALIAKRGWNCRLAGMAITPTARGQGVGRFLLKKVIADARERKDRQMVLEVIEENAPAVSLYKNSGFRQIRKLVSYSLEKPTGKQQPIEEIDLCVLGRLVSAHGMPDLPWQISGETLSQMGPPMSAYRFKGCSAAFTNPEEELIVLRSVLVTPEAVQEGHGADFLNALFAKYPGKTWRVPAIFPEEFASLFEQVGFKKEKIAQFQMVLSLM
jgi:N-acetylglutamate synthase-like GNAT family acetyltransferase